MNKIIDTNLAVPTKKTPQVKPFCRGFISIDQEMEREIAMQWFSPNSKSNSNFHGFTLFTKK